MGREESLELLGEPPRHPAHHEQDHGQDGEQRRDPQQTPTEAGLDEHAVDHDRRSREELGEHGDHDGDLTEGRRRSPRGAQRRDHDPQRCGRREQGEEDALVGGLRVDEAEPEPHGGDEEPEDAEAEQDGPGALPLQPLEVDLEAGQEHQQQQTQLGEELDELEIARPAGHDVEHLGPDHETEEDLEDDGGHSDPTSHQREEEGSRPDEDQRGGFRQDLRALSGEQEHTVGHE